MIIVVIKCQSSESKAAKSISIMLDAITDIFIKRKGYKPAFVEEDDNANNEVTIGYSVEEQNK